MATAKDIFRFGALSACVALIGCSDKTPTEVDPGVCGPTYLIANFGCADVTGRVLGSLGQPLPRMDVGVLPPSERHHFHTTHAITDANGRFTVRLIRMFDPPANGGADTVSVYIRTADRFAELERPPRSLRDSVLVRVTLVPAGERAPSTEVELRLPTP